MDAYTHNLNIILVDANNNIVSNDGFLDEIKNTLCRPNTVKIQGLDVTLTWHRLELTNIEKQFMGDLCTNAAYSIDSLIVNHTKHIISGINNELGYRIKIHISKPVVLRSPSICQDSCGVV
jgi:hypothetical protein